MKKFKFTIHGNDYAVDVHGIEDNIAHLEVNGTSYDVELHRRIKPSKTPTIVRPVIKVQAIPSIHKKEGGSSHPILAPLPGNIQILKVGKGDIVEKGQLLLVMEAMKMENRVLSDRAGVVETIRVQPGDAVLQGDTLIEIV
ncbi:MAG: acetyl-CoA carboxylase biotin carboxyl carrier protein subunit [Bacteroidales bacterium]|nr:acetyl-CoA carboxylase biotin carboxyl carrier protein subunit [Bacteroidales bacterium]